MSVSHPFVKQLKVFVSKFCGEASQTKSADDSSAFCVRDDHPLVQSFCRNIEDIFTHGIQEGHDHQKWTSYHDPHTKYWQWLRALLSLYPTREILAPLQFCIEYCKESKKAITNTGKGRLLIRCALNKKVLSRAIRLLRQHKGLLYQYYTANSLLGDDILSEMLLSLLTILEEKIQFALNVRLGSFLDETWELPVVRRYELVPCSRVGLDLIQVEGRIIVMEVESGSVGDEDLKIEPGDILDDLFGESLRKATIRRVVNLLDEFRGSPIYLSVIKCISPDGQFYRPMSLYLNAADLSKRTLFDIRERRVRELAESGGFPPNLEPATSVHSLPPPLTKADSEETPTAGAEAQDQPGRFRAKFVGFVNVGNVGTVEQIELGVYDAIKSGQTVRNVIVDLAETDVTVTCVNTHQILFRHGFPEIASCGRRIDYPLHLSYIAGETTCVLAKKFYCYVLEAPDEQQAKTMLKGIAEGFERTHWAV